MSEDLLQKAVKRQYQDTATVVKVLSEILANVLAGGRAKIKFENLTALITALDHAGIQTRLGYSDQDYQRQPILILENVEFEVEVSRS